MQMLPQMLTLFAIQDTEWDLDAMAKAIASSEQNHMNINPTEQASRKKFIDDTRLEVCQKIKRMLHLSPVR
jgi:hypothetical protein